MAYITKASLKRIVNNINKCIKLDSAFIDNNDCSFKNGPYGNGWLIYSMLTEPEKATLQIYTNVLDGTIENISFFHPIINKQINRMPWLSNDTLEWVSDIGNPPRYHYYPDCKLMAYDYLDFYIPNDIKSIGKEAVFEFRNWFKENDFINRYRESSIDKNYIIEKINKKYPSLYNLAPIVKDSNLITAEILNSATIHTSSFEEKIEELSNEWFSLFPDYDMRRFSGYRYLVYKPDFEITSFLSSVFSEDFVNNLGIEKIKMKLRKASEIAQRLINLIIDSMIKDHDDSEVSHSHKTLDYLGLECCHLCAKRGIPTNLKKERHALEDDSMVEKLLDLGMKQDFIDSLLNSPNKREHYKSIKILMETENLEIKNIPKLLVLFIQTKLNKEGRDNA